jgi:hypothetical protein
MSDLILLKDIPNLDTDYEVASVDLSQQYWYPETEGELKRGFFFGLSQRKCLDQQTSEEIELECALFVVPDETGQPVTVANGSKRLVAVFENNAVEKGTPVQVTYRGKKKNKTNGNLSDHWSVQVLQKKVTK